MKFHFIKERAVSLKHYAKFDTALLEINYDDLRAPLVDPVVVLL